VLCVMKRMLNTPATGETRRGYGWVELKNDV